MYQSEPGAVSTRRSLLMCRCNMCFFLLILDNYDYFPIREGLLHHREQGGLEKLRPVSGRYNYEKNGVCSIDANANLPVSFSIGTIGTVRRPEAFSVGTGLYQIRFHCEDLRANLPEVFRPLPLNTLDEAHQLANNQCKNCRIPATKE